MAAGEIGQAGNGLAVGIGGGVVEGALELAHGFLAKHVLDFLGIVVDVVGCDLGLVGEVELPEAVIADNLTRTLPALGREVNGIARIVGSGELMAEERARLVADFVDSLAATLGQFAQGDAFAVKLARLQYVVNSLERILAARA